VGVRLGVKPGGKLVGVKVAVKVPVTWSVGVGKLGASRVSVGAPDWGASIGAQLARNTNMANKLNVCLMTTHLVVIDENPSVIFPPRSRL